MTRKEFEELQIGSWFHSKRFKSEYLVTHTKEDRHHVERIDTVSNDKSPDFWLFEGFENYDFEAGRYPKKGMNYKAFVAMSEGDWFHSKTRKESYKITEKDICASKFWVDVYNLEGKQITKTFFSWNNCEDYDFEFFKYLEPKQDKVEKRDLSANDFKDVEAYANELYKYHDSLENRQAELDRLIEKYKLKIGFDCEPLFVNVYKHESGETEISQSYQSAQDAYEMRKKSNTYYCTAKLVPVNIGQPYTPLHNETCVIKTKNGLATKAIAVHYNNKISAISIDKEGNADCHFKAEQIEKFFPLPPE